MLRLYLDLPNLNLRNSINSSNNSSHNLQLDSSIRRLVRLHQELILRRWMLPRCNKVLKLHLYWTNNSINSNSSSNHSSFIDHHLSHCPGNLDRLLSSRRVVILELSTTIIIVAVVRGWVVMMESFCQYQLHHWQRLKEMLEYNIHHLDNKTVLAPVVVLKSRRDSVQCSARSTMPCRTFWHQRLKSWRYRIRLSLSTQSMSDLWLRLESLPGCRRVGRICLNGLVLPSRSSRRIRKLS